MAELTTGVLMITMGIVLILTYSALPKHVRQQIMYKVNNFK